MSSSPQAVLAARHAKLLRSLDPAITAVEILGSGSDVPASVPGCLVLPLRTESGWTAGAAVLRLAEGADAAKCTKRVRLALDCLAEALLAGEGVSSADDRKLLRLANELDLDFPDDARLEKALSAVAQRTGAELAWLSAPRSQFAMAVRGHDHEVNSGIQRELGRLKERVAALAGKLRRPLVLNGPSARPQQSSACRLLFVPLFIGRTRHLAWLVLANPLGAPPFGGWQILAALTLGQAIARRLEVDLDRRTGLFNRGGLAAALPRIRAKEGSLLVLDIDGLNALNQMHGMAAGDAAIMSLARLLGPPLLPEDALVARTQGDQFAIVLPNLDSRKAHAIALKIQAAAAAIRPGLPDDDSPMALSGGIVEMDEFSCPFDRYAIDADTALKLAKDRGRARIETYSAASSTVIRRHDEVIAAADLREALRTRQLLLYAQPIRLLADRSTAPGFELLLRMRDESGEIRSPGDFIAAAQRFQLLPAIDRYVVDAAFDLLTPHRALLSRLSSSISINVSGQSLTDEAFMDHFIQKMSASRLPAWLITVEVTEQAAVSNVATAEKMMRRLRDAGCGIALDDFGTGANSLVYLRSLPITRIKIDGSFVRDILTNTRSEATVKGILQLAKEFKLDTVAEFIETESVATKLWRMGAQRGQGYLFGKPLPLELAMAQLAEEEEGALREALGHS